MLSKPRIAVFIDGANAYATMKALGINLDYKRLLMKLEHGGRLLRAYYYSAILENTDNENYSSVIPLLDWLTYNGYCVVTKPAKSWYDPVTGKTKVKGNMDVEMVCDMIDLAGSGMIDHVYLFSGDGDFCEAVMRVQRRGVRVSVISTITTNPPMIADELRRQCDEFIDIRGWAKDVAKI